MSSEGLLCSTYYDTPATEADTEIVARITAICEEFEACGYRRVGAELRYQGIVVNGKKIRRLMRQHDLKPKRRRRFIATTDSDHDSPICQSAYKIDPQLECAPEGGQDQAAVLTGCRAC